MIRPAPPLRFDKWRQCVLPILVALAGSDLAAQAPAPWISTDDVPQPLPVQRPRPTPAPTPPGTTIAPFDRLSASNIVVRTKQSSSSDRSRQTQQTYNGDMRSTTTATKKTVEVELTGKDPEAGEAVVQFFFVNRENGRDTIGQPENKSCPTGSGKFQFHAHSVLVAQRNPGSSKAWTQGSSTAGWFVRVLRDNRVVGYAGSAPSYELLAQDPRQLDAAVQTAR